MIQIHRAGCDQRFDSTWSACAGGVTYSKDAVIEAFVRRKDALVARGLDVRCIDATSNVDLGMRFNRVVLGEIIEHVNDPIALLRFAARHLNPGGRVLVTTPNPFYFAWPYEAVREGIFVPNAEHVRWVSPAMVLEIGRRAGLTLDSWWCLHSEPSTLGFKLAAVMRFARFIPRLREIIAGTYIYELTLGS